jgi:hypothetical protein
VYSEELFTGYGAMCTRKTLYEELFLKKEMLYWCSLREEYIWL